MCVDPVSLDGALLSASHHRRLFWTPLPIPAISPDQTIDRASVLAAGWFPLWERRGRPPRSSMGHRWPTFTRPFEPGKRIAFPADYPRFSLGMYDDFGLAYRRGASSADLAQLDRFINRNINSSSQSKVSLRTPKSPAIALRGTPMTTTSCANLALLGWAAVFHFRSSENFFDLLFELFVPGPPWKLWAGGPSARTAD